MKFSLTGNKPSPKKVETSTAGKVGESKVPSGSVSGGVSKAPSSAPAKSAPAKPDPQTTTKTEAKKTNPSPNLLAQFFGFFSVDLVRADIITDEEKVQQQYQSIARLIKNEVYAIIVLTLILIASIPFAQPIYQYFALNTEHKTMPLVALDMPNMTDAAVISWSTVAITEVMTMGFGDYESHLKAQRFRFTPEGWESFARAFDRQKIGDSFKEHQLVLTTVPSNTPVIVGQGVNPENIYQWYVEMPVVMSFATNNNVSRRSNSVITLTIVRVSTQQSPMGIGIKSWGIGG